MLRMPLSHHYNLLYYFWRLWTQKLIRKVTYNAQDSDTKKLAIFVPYRDRRTHLKAYLDEMPEYLKRHGIKADIYVAELEEGVPFNKGAILNAAFLEALKKESYSHVCFQDVDFLPLKEADFFANSHEAIHYCYVNEMKHPCLGLMFSMTTEDFIKINGFSNFYARWGGEDDDIYERCGFAKIRVTEPDDYFHHRKDYYRDRVPHATLRREVSVRGKYGQFTEHKRAVNYKQPFDFVLIDHRVRKYMNRMFPFLYKRDGLNTVEYEIVNIEELQPGVWKYLIKHDSVTKLPREDVFFEPDGS